MIHGPASSMPKARDAMVHAPDLAVQRHEQGERMARARTLGGPREPDEHMRALLSGPGDIERQGENAYRLRVLRDSGFTALLLANDPFFRFWFRDLRRLALFLTLMRESEHLRAGRMWCFALSALAARSQMCVARVSQVLELACSTDDFRRSADPRDGRQYVFEPSSRAERALNTLASRFFEAGSAYLGCADPLPALDPAGRRRAVADFVEAALSVLGELNLQDRGCGSLTFILVVLDLLLHSPIREADFVRREASRLRVTLMTLRNTLWRAESAGLARHLGRRLWSTPLASARIDHAHELFEARLRPVLQRAAAQASPGTRPAEPTRDQSRGSTVVTAARSWTATTIGCAGA